MLCNHSRQPCACQQDRLHLINAYVCGSRATACRKAVSKRSTETPRRSSSLLGNVGSKRFHARYSLTTRLSVVRQMSKATFYDCAVLGLGGAGSAALYHLAKTGKKVIGIETHGIAHEHGSSHGATRIIRGAYHEGASST